MSSLKELESKASFDNAVALGANVLLYFYASWQEEALHANMLDVLQALQQKHSGIEVFKIEAEAVIEASEAFEITSVPTFVAIQGKNVLGKVIGANPAELSKLAAVLANTLPKPPTSNISEATKTIDTEKLKRLLTTAPVMLFMKGSPTAPRCGFSRQIVEILQTNEIPFASFDILTDEQVRSDLKVYSDWPTYPQLYVAGEIIGGLDIVKELAAGGDLKKELGIEKLQLHPPPQTLEQRLRSLLDSDKVMLFMKGNPAEPRCGFSKKIVNILNEENISFSSFDILTDEEVRSGLKTYSDWPTYPQLYVNGTLVGGLDIVEEMKSAGPLKSQLDI